jgi:hypothetical protein
VNLDDDLEGYAFVDFVGGGHIVDVEVRPRDEDFVGTDVAVITSIAITVVGS